MDIKLSSNDGAKMAEFFTAFSKAQAEINNVLAGKEAHKHKYAELHQVLSAVRKPFSDHGLAIIQTPSSTVDENGVAKDFLTSMIVHSSGEWIQASMLLPTGEAPKGMSAIQHFGSMISYARRYMLSALAGISQVDNENDLVPDKELKASLEIDLDELEKEGIAEAVKGREYLEIWYKDQSANIKAYLKKDKKGIELMSLISSNIGKQNAENMPE